MPKKNKNLAHRWRDVAKASKERHDNPKQYQRHFIGDIKGEYRSRSTCRKSTSARKVSVSEPPARLKARFTHRESQCMALISRGCSNRQAAQVMALSPRTVEFYVKNMRSKFECSSKAQLIRLVLKTEFVHRIGPILELL